MKEYFNVVLAGLAGTSHMVSATIGSLARLIYEFNGNYTRCINFIDLYFTFLCLSPLFSSLFSSLPPPFLSDLLGSELVETLLSSVTEFLSAKSREVVRSTLIFIKVREREWQWEYYNIFFQVAIAVLPHSELAPHVQELVSLQYTRNVCISNYCLPHFFDRWGRFCHGVLMTRIISEWNQE